MAGLSLISFSLPLLLELLPGLVMLLVLPQGGAINAFSCVADLS